MLTYQTLLSCCTDFDQSDFYVMTLTTHSIVLIETFIVVTIINEKSTFSSSTSLLGVWAVFLHVRVNQQRFKFSKLLGARSSSRY